MNNNDYIQLGILLVMIIGFLVSYYMLKRDNRKANEEVFDKKLNFALDNQKQYLELQAEVDKVKQRIDYLEKDVIDNYQLTCQKFDEIKKTLQDIYDKINQHIHISHIK